jgi:hypothetical protein
MLKVDNEVWIHKGWLIQPSWDSTGGKNGYLVIPPSHIDDDMSDVLNVSTLDRAKHEINLKAGTRGDWRHATTLALMRYKPAYGYPKP